MTIIRTIDNQPMQFELSREEMNNAYWETKDDFDRKRVMEALDIAAGDGDSGAGVILDSLINYPEMQKRVAYKFRDFYDGIPTWELEIQCIKDAYAYVCRNIGR